MRLFDEKYRLFGLVNPIDLAVLIGLLLLALVAARVLFGTGPTTGSTETQKITMTLTAVKIRTADVNQFVNGEVVRKKDGKPIGRLVSATVRPSEFEVPTAGGGLKRTVSPVYKDVILVVEAEGSLTEQGVMIDGARIRQNMVLDFATPRFEANDGRVSELVISK